MPLQISSSASILNEVLHTFLVSSDSERAITSILERVGRHFQVSRVYIFENASHESTFSNTYEWCDQGIPAQKERLQRIPLSVLDGYYHVFNTDNILCAPDVSKLPEYIKEYLLPQGIKALLQAALVVNGQKTGMVGFDDCARTRLWTESEISTLSILAQILNVFILNHRSDQRSRLNKGLAFSIINNLESLVYVIDVETHALLYVNNRMLEVAPDVELGKPCYKYLIQGGNKPCNFCPVITYQRHPEITQTIFDLHNPMFDIWANVHSSIFEWFDGRKVCFVSAIDISDRRRHEIKLEHLAYTDELTGLPNNRRFQRDGPLFLASAAQREQEMAVIVIKLESLHRINSTRGYEQGDSILRTFVHAINRVLPSDSFFARIRGNDFALLYPYAKNQGKAGIETLMRQVSRAAGKIRLPSSIHGWLAVSAGISIFPEDGDTFEALLRKAGLALTTSDAAAATPYVFYDAVVTAEQLAQDRLAQELALALHNGELELYYQPKIDVKTSHICGMEALMRWRHPEHGLLPGGAFIQLAEEHGLISEIDEWVINEACRHLRLLRDTGCKPVPIAINLSPDKFYQEDILAKLTSALERHDVPPELLEVELTERIALENMDKAISLMHQIRALGIKISIDDFGTGYSSLNYLRILPIDAVKLDRSFLADIEHDVAARRIVAFVVQLASLLKATVIMEGIETEEQYAFAKEIACDVVQGYHTGRPAPLAELATRLSSAEMPPWASNPPSWGSNLLRHRFLRRWLPHGLALCGAFLAGALLHSMALSTPDSEKSLGFVRDYSGLLFAIIGITGLGGLCVLLSCKYMTLLKHCRKSVDMLGLFCKNLLQGTPNKEYQLNLPSPFAELGETMTLAAQKLYAQTQELRERENSLEQANSKLKEEQGKYRTIAEAVSDVLWEVDLPSGIMHFSDNFMDFSGHIKQDFKYPEEILIYVHPEDRENLLAHMRGLRSREYSSRGEELRMRIANGGYVWIRSSGSLVCDEQGAPLRIVGAFSNISAYKQQEMLLIERSQRDPLTGLLNRSEGESRVLRALSTDKNTVLLIIVSITNFREIHNRYGQDCSDNVLRTISRRLADVAENNDVLYRCAGNEFALLKAFAPSPMTMNQFTPETFTASLREKLNKPHDHRGISLSLECALGVLVVDEANTNGPLLLQRAYETLVEARAADACCIQWLSKKKNVH